MLQEADSLCILGRLYTDSAAMAEAVKALTTVRWVYPTQYANANYHYGRILRERGNQTEAMQCFINAIHSNTSDHHLIGRVYSNIGAMCYYTEKHEMAYGQFVKAFEQFKLTNDTTAYFNAIYNMAVGTAALGKKEETLRYTKQIEDFCNDTSIISLSFLAKSIMYKYCQQYDSSLYYANRYLDYNPKRLDGLIIKAQSFSFLGEQDSALYYAKFVYEHSSSPKEKYSALYILSHDNPNLDKDSVLTLTSAREDIHNLELAPKYKEYSKAMLLLEQDMNRKPDYLGWGALAAVLATVVTVAVSWRRIAQKRKVLRKEEAVNRQRINSFHENTLRMLEDNCKALQNTNLYDTLHWGDYDKMCNDADRQLMSIVSKLLARQTENSHISEKEIRLCVLVLIDGFGSKQLADLLFYAESGIRSLKSRTAKKIDTDSRNFRTSLIKIAVNEELAHP